MLGRLVVGLVKGLAVGLLVGYALTRIGFGVPGGVMAYLGAAVAGVLTGLIAGKPIWAKDAKIEAGMKALVGAGLAAVLMYVTRRWLTFDLPGGILGLLTSIFGEAERANFGELALTSTATVAGALGAFYEVDNTPAEASAKPANKSLANGAPGKRIAEAGAEDEEDELEHEPEKKRAKK